MPTETEPPLIDMPVTVRHASANGMWVLAKQAELLYRGFVPAAIGTLLISVLFVSALWGRQPSSVLLGWLGAIWLVVLMRGALVWQFFRQAPGPEKIQPWISRFVFGAIAAGTAWGATAWMFIPQGDSFSALLTGIFAAGVGASGCFLLAPMPRAVTLFLLPLLLPVMLRFLWLGERNIYIGWVVFVYLMVLLEATRRGHALIWKTMVIGIENERLQSAIGMEKRLAELQYREVFQNMTDGLIVLDVTDDGRFRLAGANPALERMTGIIYDDAYHKYIEDLVPPPVAAQATANYRRCMETGMPIQYEVVLHMPVGKAVFDTVLIPMRDVGGRIHRLIGITRDITVRRRIDDALQFVAQRGWGADGESFLTALARYLGKALEVDYVMIAKLAENAGGGPRQSLSSPREKRSPICNTISRARLARMSWKADWSVIRRMCSNSFPRISS